MRRLPVLLIAHSQSTLETGSSAAGDIESLWWFMLVAATVVVAIVVALALLAILRRRGRAGDRLAGRLGNPWLIAVGGVAFPLAVLSVLFGLTLNTMLATAPAHGGTELRVEVTGNQWFWEVRYPGRDRAVTANEIHVPVDTPVAIEVRTDDVLHSFWVPALQRKIDLIPGRSNTLTFEVSDPGVYRGQCAEYCGIQHAHMAFLVIAQEAEEFDEWLSREAQPASPPEDDLAAEGRTVFMEEGCAGCHTIRGTEANGKAGPDLTHVASRDTLAAVTIDNDRGGLAEWVLSPQHVKPGAKMPGIEMSESQARALLAYLRGLE